MLESLRVESFSEHKGSGFRMLAGENLAIELTLADVTPLGNSGVREAFSLIFHAAAGAPILPQRIYRLEHDALGALDLFVVPLGPKGGAFRYEVIFT